MVINMRTATVKDENRRLSELEDMKVSLELQLKEMTKKVRSQQQQIELAKLDTLTGLRNRAGVSDEINQILKSNQQGMFFILDMDNFKQVNDTYGHVEGDLALVRFANALKHVVDEDEILARIGGDEFIIFTPYACDRNEIRKRASQIIRNVTRELVMPGKLIRLTVSMGIAIAPGDGMTYEKLYANADDALYQVKNRGKGAFQFCDETFVVKKEKPRQKATLLEITTNLKEKKMDGSFAVEYESFEKIYRFLERNIAREQREVQCVLFSVEEPMDLDYDEIEMQRHMEHLQHAITSVLRRGDVTTNYSANQVLVLLLDVNTENAKHVVERIMKQFLDETADDTWDITNEIQQLVPEERA